RHLTPEQIFWSEDVHKHLTNVPKPITALTVYPPNTPAKLVPRNILRESKLLSLKKSKKNLLFENENLIADCLSNELLYSVMNDVNTISRFSEMRDAYTIEQTRCLELEAEISKPTRKKFTLGEQCPLTRITNSKVVPLQQHEHVSTNEIVITKRFSNTTQKPLTRTPTEIGDPKYQTLHLCLFSNAGRTDRPMFIETVKFGNDHFGAIMGYGDYVIGDSVISRVYYVKGLGHNLFSVGQFCNSDLEVAFKKHSCYVRDVDGVELLKASKNKSWLWHRRLNHLNFGNINDLERKDLVRGLPRLKFKKDHIFSACQLGKSMKVLMGRDTFWSSLMIIQDLVKFLRSKDETPEFVIKFLKQVQVGFNKTVRFIQTDNDIEFVNQVLTEFYESVDITHQKYVLRTPQQNGVVKRRNRTLVEVTRTMLIFFKALMFLWAETVATACYTQNRSLIHTHHNKTHMSLCMV
ncbi:retrovirus-related pol polyprotein from transposon TNT 1-94, partial [Tanacetum coccineum]